MFAIGAIDGPECKLPIAEKSRRLKELQNAWRNPRFTSTYIIDCDPYMHAVLGDTVVQWTPTDDMHFIRIPSNIRLVHDDCWSINGPELGFQIYVPYGDPSQDLLAIVELTEEDEYVVRGVRCELPVNGIQESPTRDAYACFRCCRTNLTPWQLNPS